MERRHYLKYERNTRVSNAEMMVIVSVVQDRQRYLDAFLLEMEKNGWRRIEQNREKVVEVDVFDDKTLRSHIQDALNQNVITIPQGKKVAFVTHADLEGGGKVSGAFVVKVGKEWQVATLVDWSHEEGVGAGINLAWSK